MLAISQFIWLIVRWTDNKPEGPDLALRLYVEYHHTEA